MLISLFAWGALTYSQLDTAVLVGYSGRHRCPTLHCAACLCFYLKHTGGVEKAIGVLETAGVVVVSVHSGAIDHPGHWRVRIPATRFAMEGDKHPLLNWQITLQNPDISFFYILHTRHEDFVLDFLQKLAYFKYYYLIIHFYLIINVCVKKNYI